MDNDSGRGSRSNEPPKLATVRRLHLDETEGSSATATEEWYETERLTGQITGGRSAPPVDQPAPLRDEALVALDWRHAESAPPPTALQRLGRSLADRGHRVVSLFALAGHHSHGLAAAGARDAAVPSHPQAQRPRLAMLTTRRAVAPPTVEPREDKPTVDEVLAAEPSSPRTGPRGSADLTPQHLDWRSAPAPNARRERRPRPWPRVLIGTAVVLTAAAVAVIAITSHTNDRAVSSREASFAAATSRPRVALIAAAKTVTAVLGTVEHQARITPARQRIYPRHAHPRRRAHHQQSQPARPHTSSQAAPQISTGSTSQTSAAPSATTGQSGGGSASGGVGSSSGASPPASSASAPSSAPAKPTGATGALGPIGSPNG
jgi:hypothetical protein